MVGTPVSRETANGSGRGDGPETVQVIVDPGICGFGCTINGWKKGKQVSFDIRSECGQIKKLTADLRPVQMKDLFVPLTKSPFFLCAEKSRCHLACPIPSALVKTAEVVLGLALPRDATIRFLT
ncbi:MAG: hypothetical protein K9N21_11425 [Deltaproteobacteria bacterium]|nr:hypothetical protein [Deltaproteobacteria bacterium]